MLPKYYLNIIGTTTLVVPVYATIKGKLAIGGNSDCNSRSAGSGTRSGGGGSRS